MGPVKRCIAGLAILALFAAPALGKTIGVNGGRTTYTITGHFKNAHKASGTLRITGPVPTCLHGDSGVLNWTAS
jgi:hypothetical protein